MNDLRKAAEMALKFCEDIGDLAGPYPYVNETAVVSDSRKVLQALRQALAQPEQEPVAWVLHRELFWPSEYEVISEAGDNAIPLYTAPQKREWVGLTAKDLAEIPPSCFEGAIWADAKLKEKNA